MQDYETEEQQLEALKKWWHENGTSLIVGLGLGVAILFGGRYYINMQSEHRASAGDLYFMVADQVNKNNEQGALETTARLTSEYQDTPYAALAALIMARFEFEQGNPAEATSQLEWVINNAEQIELQNIARLRLARVHLGNAEYDAAEVLLSADHPTAFNAAYEELKGDVYVLRGRLAEARIAYDKAIEAMGNNTSAWLRLKRQDLGNIQPEAADPVAPPA